MRRNTQRKLNAAASGYAELMAMSDEFVLERARAIQQALLDQRKAAPPAAVQSQIIHPDRQFVAPPTGLAELEDYIRNTVKKEIARGRIEFGAELGSGEFGAVFEGFYTEEDGADDKLKVAIKMLRKATSDEDKARFLKEAAIMAQFSHPNIVSLTGVCTQPSSEPVLIVLEYMHLGALQGYLQSPMVKDQLESLTMIRMALDVAAAMQYLGEAGFVHRDLAARNVLLDKTMTCRVGDFGLSVDLASTEDDEKGTYAGNEGDKIPIRWTSIEAICFRQFSTASDVWSYGILLWEIWTYSDLPYKGWNNKKVTEEVSNGYRLPKPANCPDEVYRIMIDCWNKNVKRRITFPKINTALVQAWKDVARETIGGDQGNDNLYDAGDGDQADGGAGAGGGGTALYDTGDDGGGNGETGGSALYDTGDDTEVKVDRTAEIHKQAASRGGLLMTGGSALYDAGDDLAATVAAPPAKVETKDADQDDGGFGFDGAIAVTAVNPILAKPVYSDVPVSEEHVGKRVHVTNFCDGTLRFFGPHHRDGKPRCGVELDEGVGINNGTVGDHCYFICEMKYGVLVDPRSVVLLDDQIVAEKVPNGGYLSILPSD